MHCDGCPCNAALWRWNATASLQDLERGQQSSRDSRTGQARPGTHADNRKNGALGEHYILAAITAAEASGQCKPPRPAPEITQPSIQIWCISGFCPPQGKARATSALGKIHQSHDGSPLAPNKHS